MIRVTKTKDGGQIWDATVRDIDVIPYSNGLCFLHGETMIDNKKGDCMFCAYKKEREVK